jgi:hypothetical protein
MKPLSELSGLSSRIAREYQWQIKRMGPPPEEPRNASEAREIFAAVRQGDGKYDEAIAAVMWHCGLSDEGAEEAIGDYVQRGRIKS